MTHRFFPPAERHLHDIWDYTSDRWGESQAETYVRELFAWLDALPERAHLWHAIPGERLRGAFFARYRSHFVFFRRLSSGDIGVLAILHETRDIPRRLAEIADDSG